MRDTVIMLRILDDTVCERLSENVWVNLSSNTPDVEILDGSYSYSISPSIENCPKLVLFVHGSDRLRPIESRIVDTLSLLGVDIHTVQPGGISNITPEDYAAIIVSTSVTDSRVGERLRSAAAPVLCMSLPNYLTLGLASDTGHDFNSSIQVQVAMGGLSGSVQITLSYESIPWAYAESKAEVIATVVNGDIIQPQGENAAEKAVIHRYDVGDFSSQFAEGGPPARRCTFPICQASGRRGVPQYTLAWWKLLKYCFGWTAGIDVSRFIRN